MRKDSLLVGAGSGFSGIIPNHFFGIAGVCLLIVANRPGNTGTRLVALFPSRRSHISWNVQSGPVAVAVP